VESEYKKLPAIISSATLDLQQQQQQQRRLVSSKATKKGFEGESAWREKRFFIETLENVLSSL